MTAAGAVAAPIVHPLPVRRADRRDDRDFIVDSWRKSFWEGDGVRRYTDRDEYYRDMGRRIEAILASSDAFVTHDPEDLDNLVGWLVRQGTALHYVYVRYDFRGEGHGLSLAARALQEGPLEVFTSWPKGLRGRLWGLRYRPLWSPA